MKFKVVSEHPTWARSPGPTTELSADLSLCPLSSPLCVSRYLLIPIPQDKGVIIGKAGPPGPTLEPPQTLSPEPRHEVVGKDGHPSPISHSEATRTPCVPTNPPPTTPAPLHTSHCPSDCSCPQVAMETGTNSADAISQNGQTWSPALRIGLPRAPLNELTHPPSVSGRALQLPTAWVTALAWEGRKAE